MEKESDKDKSRFLNIAQGSVAELIIQIYIGIEIGYIGKELGMQWVREPNEIQRMLNTLKKNYA